MAYDRATLYCPRDQGADHYVLNLFMIYRTCKYLDFSLTLMSALMLRIWGGQNDKFRLIIEWEVHLPSLQYLGDQVILSINYVEFKGILLSTRIIALYTVTYKVHTVMYKVNH